MDHGSYPRESSPEQDTHFEAKPALKPNEILLKPLVKENGAAETPKVEAGQNTAEQETKEWLDTAKAKFELVQDKDGMEEVVREFNSHYKVKPDISLPFQQERVMIASVPEGDFVIMLMKSIDRENPHDEMAALELPPFKPGDTVKVDFGDNVIDSGWTVTGFDIKNTPNGPEGMVNVQKQDSGHQMHTRQFSRKELRRVNS